MTINVTKESESQVYLRTPHWKICDQIEKTGLQKIDNLLVTPEGVTIRFENNGLLSFSWRELETTAKNLPIETISLKDGKLKSGFSVGPDYVSGQFKFNQDGCVTDPTGEVLFRFHPDSLPKI